MTERRERHPNPRVRAYHRVIIFLAAAAAVRKARKHQHDVGLFLDREREIAYHEAAHAVAAHMAGFFVHQLSIIPDPFVLLGPGRKHYLGGSITATSTRQPPEVSVPSDQSDYRSAAELCWLLGTECTWKS